jgi:hypothetical protein
LLTCACAGLENSSLGEVDGLKPWTAIPRPATTEAISAILRAEKTDRRGGR